MDKIIIEALAKERERQERCLELIASENYVSNDILKLQSNNYLKIIFPLHGRTLQHMNIRMKCLRTSEIS